MAFYYLIVFPFLYQLISYNRILSEDFSALLRPKMILLFLLILLILTSLTLSTSKQASQTTGSQASRKTPKEYSSLKLTIFADYYII